MGAPKLQVDSPLSIRITEAGRKVFEKSFTHSPITIGRSSVCDVHITDYSWISRQHFQVVSIGGKWIVIDLNSSSGLIYEKKQHSQLELKPGLELRIGPLTVHFNFAESAPIRPSRPVTSRAGTMTGTDLTNLTNVRSAHPPPHPVQFRNTKKVKLAEPWFTQSREKIRFMSRDSGVSNLQIHTTAENMARTVPQRRALEVYVTWKDQIYDSRLFFTGDSIGVGTGPDDLYAPIIAGTITIGRFDGNHSDFYLGKGAKGKVFRAGAQPQFLEQMLKADGLPRRGKHHVLSLNATDRCEIDLGANLKLNARYTVAPRQLSKAAVREPDQMLRRALSYSGAVHLAFLLIAMFLAPTHDVPKIKHLSPRVARLLTQKKVEPAPAPKPPEPPEQAPPEPVKVAEKIPPPKKKPEIKRRPPPPKKVVVHVNEKLKVINKLPPAKVQAEKSVPVVQKPPDLNQLGALAALGALGTPSASNPTNLPVAINVNPNAGGQTSPSTSGMIGAVKAQGGKLQEAGVAGVKTKGTGYGTGTGYGVQGLKGVAGSRGVGGAVIGSPKLMELTRDEGLTQKQVMDTVKLHLAKIQHCYERSLLSTPQLAGRVEYEWEIAPQGGVKWAKVKRSDIAGGDGLNNCVTDVFKKMKFPIAKNGLSTTPSIGFPFGRL